MERLENKTNSVQANAEDTDNNKFDTGEGESKQTDEKETPEVVPQHSSTLNNDAEQNDMFGQDNIIDDKIVAEPNVTELLPDMVD